MEQPLVQLKDQFVPHHAANVTDRRDIPGWGMRLKRHCLVVLLLMLRFINDPDCKALCSGINSPTLRLTLFQRHSAIPWIVCSVITVTLCAGFILMKIQQAFTAQQGPCGWKQSSTDG